jgi:hypothetical protein
MLLEDDSADIFSQMNSAVDNVLYGVLVMAWPSGPGDRSVRAIWSSLILIARLFHPCGGNLGLRRLQNTCGHAVRHIL